MSDTFTDQLSDYLDDELAERERRALEVHLAGCADCRHTLDQLRRVVAEAAALTPAPPPIDLWPGIASRMLAGDARDTAVAFRPRTSRRISFTLPQLAAASLLLAAISSAIAWQLRPAPAANAPAAVADAAATPAVPDDAADPVLMPVNLADQEYDTAVDELEKTLEAGRSVLDPETIAIVEQNLQIINVAIDQAREALEADPANGYLSRYLVQARRKKLNLLRRAAALTAESAQS